MFTKLLPWEWCDPVNRYNNKSRMAETTPTGSPKSVRNRWIMQVFGGVFMLPVWFFFIFCWAFVKGQS